MIINEVYIGKIKEIVEMENTFGEARYFYINNNKNNAMKYLSKLEIQIEEFFGFDSFSIDILPSNELNAITLPVSSSLDIDAYTSMITNSTGYKFSKKAKVSSLTRITSGLFKNKNFKNDEVFAILLHEIGHSFISRSPLIDAEQDLLKIYTVLCILLNAILTAGQSIIPDIYNSLNISKKIESEYNKLIKKIPILRDVNYSFDVIIGKIFLGLYNAIDFLLTLSGFSYFINKINKKSIEKMKVHSNSYNRSVERISDDFATIYGYGVELSSALLKLENNDYSKNRYDDFIKKIPGLNMWFEKSKNLGLEVLYQLGDHPNSADRILKITENMKYTLKNDKNLTKKEKSAVQNQINELEKIIKDCIEVQGELKKNPDKFKVALLSLGFKQGSTEDTEERKYTNMEDIDAEFDNLRIDWD